MIRVKICGITRLEDAVVALQAGADYLGFILYPPSPRAIAPDNLAALVGKLRRRVELEPIFSRPVPPLLVGVFVNETPFYMAKVMAECNLDLAQLSGDEPAAQVNDPASEIFGRAYKAVRLPAKDESMVAFDYYAKYMSKDNAPFPRLLIDTPHESLYGGTGQTSNWTLAAQLAAQYPDLMLAGGLTPDNVAEAIRQVKPFAVDVAGGVESAPGQKDHALIRAFITQAKSVLL
jgi:phosphoribosylanthranilate isomerase